MGSRCSERFRKCQRPAEAVLRYLVRAEEQVRLLTAPFFCSICMGTCDLCNQIAPTAEAWLHCVYRRCHVHPRALAMHKANKSKASPSFRARIPLNDFCSQQLSAHSLRLAATGPSLE